jgi:KDO2-lipid IV(A) lauroyltransferase
VVVETIKLLSISEKELKARIRHENPEFADSIISAGGSYVAVATHMGNWEWLLAGTAIYLNGKIDVVYKLYKKTVPYKFQYVIDEYIK